MTSPNLRPQQGSVLTTGNANKMRDCPLAPARAPTAGPVIEPPLNAPPGTAPPVRPGTDLPWRRARGSPGKPRAFEK
jgi:hypothetical protein